MLYQKAAHRTNVLAWVTVALGVALIAVEGWMLRRAGVAHGGGTGGGRSAAGEALVAAGGSGTTVAGRDNDGRLLAVDRGDHRHRGRGCPGGADLPLLVEERDYGELSEPTPHHGTNNGSPTQAVCWRKRAFSCQNKLLCNAPNPQIKFLITLPPKAADDGLIEDEHGDEERAVTLRRQWTFNARQNLTDGTIYPAFLRSHCWIQFRFGSFTKNLKTVPHARHTSA